MTTLIFDIDGTLTDMWPIERTVLLAMSPRMRAAKLDEAKARGIKSLRQLYRVASGSTITAASFRNMYQKTFIDLASKRLLPMPKPYRAAKFIINHHSQYRCAYATGGLKLEAEYVLSVLGLAGYFDIESSVSGDVCRFAKSTGIPFGRLQKKFGDCIVITDSSGDMSGAGKANVPAIQLAPNQKLTRGMLL